MPSIDGLSINITASTTTATKSIQQLEARLASLSKSLNNLDGGSKLRNLAGGVDALAKSMSRMNASTSSQQFSALAKNLDKLGAINSGKINSTASSLQRLIPALRGVGNSNVNKDVISLTKALSSLARTDLSRFARTDFTGLGNSLTRLVNSLAQADKVSASTASLVRALSSLANAGANVNQTSASLPLLGQRLMVLINALSLSSSVSSRTAQLVTAIASLANAGTRAGATASNLSRLGTELSKLINTLANAPKVNKNTTELVKALSQISTKSTTINTSVGRLGTGLNNLIPSVNNTKNAFNGLAVAFGKFYANCWLLIRAFKTLWKSVKSSMEMGEIYNYFTSSVKQIANRASSEFEQAGYESAEAYSKALQEGIQANMLDTTKKMSGYTANLEKGFEFVEAKNLGINPADLIRAQTQFAQLSSSMGVSSEYAVKLSEALTKVGADLASVKDQDFNEVWKSLSSGLVGMARSLDQYGTNIREANLNQELMNLGIDTTAKKLNQNDKALLRTIILLKTTDFAWGDLAGTLDSTANQTRLLRASFSNLGRAIGGLFLGAITRVLPYISAFAMALQKVLEMVANLFGIEIPVTTSQASSEIGDLNDAIYGTGDALDSASSSAKKLKQNLLGMDELTVINSDTGGAGNVGGIGGVSSALEKAFDDIFKKFDDVWEDAYEKAENKAQTLCDKMIDALKKGDWKKIGTTLSNYLTTSLNGINWDFVYASAKNFGKGLANFLNGLINPELFGALGRTIGGALNTALYFLNSFGHEFDFKNFGKSIAEGINQVLSTYDFAVLADTINVWVDGLANAIWEAIKNIDKEKAWSAIKDFFGNLELDSALVIGIPALLFAWKGATSIASLFATFLAPTGTLNLGAMNVALGNIVIQTIAGVTLASLAEQVIWGAVGEITGNEDKAEALKNTFNGLTGAIDSAVMAVRILVTEMNGWTVSAHWDNGIVQYYIDLGDAMERISNGETISDKELLSYQNAVVKMGGSAEEASENIEMMRQAMLDYDDINSDVEIHLRDVADAFGLYDESVETLSNLRDALVELDGNYEGQLKTNKKYTDSANELINTMNHYGISVRSVNEEIANRHGWGNYIEGVHDLGTAFDGMSISTERFGATLDVVELSEINTTEALNKQSASLVDLSAGWDGQLHAMKSFKDINDGTTQRLRDLGQATKDSAKDMTTGSTNTNLFEKALESFRDKSEVTKQGLYNLKDQSTRTTTEMVRGFGEVSSKGTDTSDNINRKFGDMSTNVSKSFSDMQRDVNSSFDGLEKDTTTKLSNIVDKLKTIFSTENIVNSLKGVSEGFERVFSGLGKVIVTQINKIIEAINKTFELKWDDIEIAGQKIIEGGTAKLIHIEPITGYRTGGFIEDGIFTMNKGEIAGTFNNGKSVVANNEQIIEGIKRGVTEAVASQMIPYLSSIASTNEEIAQKQFGITSREAYNAVLYEDRKRVNTTGLSGFVF